MQRQEKQLWKKLIIVIVIKLIIITTIYWVFMHPSAQKVDDVGVQKHLLS